MEEKKRYKVYRTIMLIILVAFVTFILTSVGFYQYFVKGDSLNKYLTFMTSDGSQDISQTLDTYRAVIDKYYLGDVNEESLKEGAVKGYIEGLGDPYTEYISKEDMEDYMEDTMGNFVGIGIYMTEDPETNQIMVLAPIKGSPAEKAGIQPGDYIVSVNGEPCTADDMTVISNKIKGEEGTTVKLQILRGEETLDFEIARENIIVNPVEGEVLENNIGYIEFSSFDENTAEEFKTRFEELQAQGITSLIIDVRSNPGGHLNQTKDILELFMDKNKVLYQVEFKEDKEKIKDETKASRDYPVVVLINSSSASASEILAASFQDSYSQATLVGETTYGKGTVQQAYSLTDGSSLKYTTERWLTPKGKWIDGKGVSPDYEVSLSDDYLNNPIEDNDSQLQKALELLKNS